MAEVYYRLKSAGGPFTRVVGTSPIEVTGLTDGVLYEYAQGDDTLAEIMPGVAPSVIATPTITGAQVGSTPVVNAGTYGGSPAPTVTPGTLELDGVVFDPPTELQPADEGKTLTYTGEVATNPLGSVSPADVSESVVLDPDAAAYITAVETADGQTLEAGVKTAYETFITGCKTDGSWAAIQSSAILAGARTLSGALVALKGTAPTNVSSNFVSADYDRKTGLKGDGATKYLDTNTSSNVAGPTDTHIAAYITSTETSGYAIAAGVTANGPAFFQCYNGGMGGRMRSGSFLTTPLVDALPGFFSGVRDNSADFRYRGGGTTETFTDPDEGSSTSDNFLIFSRNASDFGNHRISFYSAGNAVDETLLEARVTQLMTDLDGAIV